MTQSVGGNGNSIPKLGMANKPLPAAGPKAEPGPGASGPAAPGAAPAAKDGLSGGVAGLSKGPEGMSPFSFTPPASSGNAASSARARTQANETKAQADREAAAKGLDGALKAQPPQADAVGKAALAYMQSGSNPASSYQQAMKQVPDAQKSAVAKEMLKQLSQNPAAAASTPRELVQDMARAAGAEGQALAKQVQQHQARAMLL